jgi:hypothetical protein
MCRGILLLMVLAISPVNAGNPLPGNQSELIDIWGSVLYCKAIYDEPDISGRIYEGDRKSCDEAHRSLGMHALDSWPEEEVQAVFEHAQHKSAVIRYNTRSIQEAVAACRELCRAYND